MATTRAGTRSRITNTFELNSNHQQLEDLNPNAHLEELA